MPKDKSLKSRSDKHNASYPQLSQFCLLARVCEAQTSVTSRYSFFSAAATFMSASLRSGRSMLRSRLCHRPQKPHQHLPVFEQHQSSKCKQLRHAGGLNWTPGSYWINKNLISVPTAVSGPDFIAFYDVTLDIRRSVASSLNYVSNYPTCLCLLCPLLTLNAEHLPQFQRSSSDFAQGSDDALGVGLRQEGAGVQNALLIFTWKGTKNRKSLDFDLLRSPS